MIEIFKFISSLMAKIVVKWQSISLGGFRPFWYLVGISLLTIFGFFFRGLLFGGAGGGWAAPSRELAHRAQQTRARA